MQLCLEGRMNGSSVTRVTFACPGRPLLGPLLGPLDVSLDGPCPGPVQSESQQPSAYAVWDSCGASIDWALVRPSV